MEKEKTPTEVVFKTAEDFVNDPRLMEILNDAQDSGIRLILNVSGEPLDGVWEDLYTNKYAMLQGGAPQSLKLTAITNILKSLEDENNMKVEVAMSFVTILLNKKQTHKRDEH